MYFLLYLSVVLTECIEYFFPDLINQITKMLLDLKDFNIQDREKHFPVYSTQSHLLS